MKTLSVYFSIASLVILGCFANNNDSVNSNQNTQESSEKGTEAILGGGCFWCAKTVFEKINGVTEVISGYAGGKSENPTYKEICTGKSGHAEVIKIIFDPGKISFAKILDIFGLCHDPTTLNRQGADVGTQYRSTIMYLSDEQKKIAEDWKKKLSNKFANPVVTEIVKAPIFYRAEEYHQDYYRKTQIKGIVLMLSVRS